MAPMVGLTRSPPRLGSERSRLWRQHGGCLDLDLGPLLDEGNDLHQRHGRKVPADDAAIDLSYLAETGQILVLVHAHTS